MMLATGIVCFTILFFFLGGWDLILTIWKKIQGCPQGGHHQMAFYARNNFGGRIYTCVRCGEREVSGGRPLE
ncbi:MAG: hypothetical protein Q7S10_00770 [bacterium]|nr:hypothetical protein [bacterium]